MSWRSAKPRYRGYRPPPLWWFKLKYRACVAVISAMIGFVTYRAGDGLISGRVPAMSKQPNQMVEWVSTPGLFVWHLMLWIGTDLVLAVVFCLLIAKLKELRGPSAETRI